MTRLFRILVVMVLAGAFPVPAEPLNVSGIYPGLAVYNSGGECGIGAVVPWAGQLWFITYPPHQRHGSDDKLYSLDAQMRLTVHPESVGGTHANRMIHRESSQLIIGPYVISADGKVRAFDVKNALPGRMTATARHLSDPAHKVYFVDMEGPVWEADVYTLQTHKLFEKPVPGWHAKGAYSGQGVLVVANNGESPAMGDLDKSKITADLKAHGPEDAGVLAEWNQKQWSIIQRRQHVEVTGPGGIYGNAKESDPIWAVGWDRRSVLLEVRDRGKWQTFRLPKATHAFDPKHGWYTEWPRIREVSDGKWLMDMHGMFFAFPPTFRAGNTGGIRPIASHLRYIPDFCGWNGRLVLAADDTSIMQNPMAGRSQSSLWFGSLSDLPRFGPGSGWGGVWDEDAVGAGAVSDPFLIAGFQQRVLHLVQKSDGAVNFTIQVDATGRGDWKTFKSVQVPANGYRYEILPADLAGEWLRVAVDRACTATAYLHMSSPRDTARDRDGAFAALAPATDAGAMIGGLIRPAKENRNLQFVAQRIANGRAETLGYYEVNDKLEFVKPAAQQELRPPAAVEDRGAAVEKVAAIQPQFSEDAASIILTEKGQRYRLPRAPGNYALPGFGSRAVRECVSERNLLNAGGSFFEMGRENGAETIKPVCTHGRRIVDSCTWRGLMVISGISEGAKADGHCFRSADGRVGLWFGMIDDLWRLGKPVGVGGPWKNTAVKAGEASDPYLMTNYDRKQLTVSSDSDSAVTFAVEVNFDHRQWVTFTRLRVAPGQSLTYFFPEGFSAHWVRLRASVGCHATATFEYR